MAPIYLLFFAWLIRSGMKKKNKLKSYRYRSNAIVRLNAYFTFGNSIRKDAPKVEASEGEFEMSSNATDGSEEICVFLPHSLIQAEYRWVEYSRHIFSSNQIVHKILFSLCFWAPDPLIDKFY